MRFPARAPCILKLWSVRECLPQILHGIFGCHRIENGGSSCRIYGHMQSSFSSLLMLRVFLFRRGMG